MFGTLIILYNIILLVLEYSIIYSYTFSETPNNSLWFIWLSGILIAFLLGIDKILPIEPELKKLINNLSLITIIIWFIDRFYLLIQINIGNLNLC